MKRNLTRAAPPSGRSRRVGWVASFVIAGALLISTLTLEPVSAATLEPGEGEPSGSPGAVEVAEPEEEPEEEVEEAAEQSRECPAGQPEGEEGGETAGEAEQGELEWGESSAGAEEPESEDEVESCPGKKRTGVPPANCLLRSARARLFAYSSRDRVRLVIRYTTFAPASVGVKFRLGGGKGTQKLGAATRRFAASGLFRVTEKLSPKKMAKVLAAKRFTVTMGIATAPQICQHLYTRHLTVRRRVGGQTVWYQSGPAFGTRPA